MSKARVFFAAAANAGIVGLGGSAPLVVISNEEVTAAEGAEGARVRQHSGVSERSERQKSQTSLAVNSASSSLAVTKSPRAFGISSSSRRSPSVMSTSSQRTSSVRSTASQRTSSVTSTTSRRAPSKSSGTREINSHISKNESADSSLVEPNLYVKLIEKYSLDFLYQSVIEIKEADPNCLITAILKQAADRGLIHFEKALHDERILRWFARPAFFYTVAELIGNEPVELAWGDNLSQSFYAGDLDQFTDVAKRVILKPVGLDGEERFALPRTLSAARKGMKTKDDKAKFKQLEIHLSASLLSDECGYTVSKYNSRPFFWEVRVLWPIEDAYGMDAVQKVFQVLNPNCALQMAEHYCRLYKELRPDYEEEILRCDENFKIHGTVNTGITTTTRKTRTAATRGATLAVPV